MLNTCKSNGSAESLLSGGEWRTGEEHVGICLRVGNNSGKPELIPHMPQGVKVACDRSKMSLRPIS